MSVKKYDVKKHFFLNRSFLGMIFRVFRVNDRMKRPVATGFWGDSSILGPNVVNFTRLDTRSENLIIILIYYTYTHYSDVSRDKHISNVHA